VAHFGAEVFGAGLGEGGFPETLGVFGFCLFGAGLALACFGDEEDEDGACEDDHGEDGSDGVVGAENGAPDKLAAFGETAEVWPRVIFDHLATVARAEMV
jgi:hypothetical protein